VAQKIGTLFLYALTLSNINRSSKLFHCQNQEKIYSNTITKDPTTPSVSLYYLVKCQHFTDREIGQWRRQLECIL